MKRFVFFILITLLLSSCSKVLVTGRRQLNLVSDSEMSALSLQSYNEFMSTAKISKNKEATALIEKVGRKLTSAVESYLKETGNSAMISNYKWKYSLVESTEVNAFCMPGGQIVFYEGILPYTQDETGIATVMGHEISHAIAKHGAERVSQQLVVELGSGVTEAVVANKSALTKTAISTVYGLGSQVAVLLPYSRTHEYEADHMGLIFMAKAGYDPNMAISFWQRMAQGKTANVPEFLSTHPSDANRIAKLKAALPEAMKYYKK